jgi:hypothetical protein
MRFPKRSGGRPLQLLAGAVVAFAMSGTGYAQGVVVRDARLPRTADGRPNLNAPVPRAPDGRPDLSGIWRATTDGQRRDLAAGVPVAFQPWAEALFKERLAGRGPGNPTARCLPRSVPAVMLVPEYPWKLVQTPGLIMILFHENLHYRQIFTDGRGFPEDPAPTWLGYSIARWENDTLVVDTRGLNDQIWLDDGGHPHSEALHVIERFRRRTVGTMDLEITIDDAGAYARPWTAMVRLELLPDTELTETTCGVRAAE